MFGFEKCRVYRDDTVAVGTVKIAAGNSLDVEAGDRIQVRVKEWVERAQITLDEGPNIAERDKNTILSGKWRGEPGVAGSYRRVSALEMRWHTLRNSKRAWVGLVLSFLAIALAYINAGMQQNGTMVWHLGPVKAIIFGLSALTALLAWSRDTWIS